MLCNAVKVNLSEVRYGLSQLTIRKIGRFLRDFYLVFERDFYRSQTNSKFARFFPRTHYIFIGQASKFTPNPYFDPSEYASLSPYTRLKNSYPFFHYLLRSNGHNPKTRWDYSYLAFAIEALNFEGPLISHNRKYHNNEYRNGMHLKISETPFQSLISTQPKKTFQITNSRPLNLEVEKKLALDIKVSNCNVTVIAPSTLVEESSSIQCSVKRENHCHEGLHEEIALKINVTDSGMIEILAHQPIVVSLDFIIKLFLLDLSDLQKESQIEWMLKKIDAKKKYISGLNTRSYSSFSMELSELITPAINNSISNVVSSMNHKTFNDASPRILLISHEDSFTGAPIYLKQLYEQLGLQGFDVHIVSLRPKHRRGLFSSLKRKHTYLEDYREKQDDALHLVQNWLLTKKGEVAFRKALISIKPDLVLANTLSSSDAIRIAYSMSLPSILYVHESWNFDGSGWTTEDHFQLRVAEALEAAHLTLFGSYATQSHWQSSGFAINSLDIPTYRRIQVPEAEVLELKRRKVRTKFNIKERDKVFLSIATFEPRKRIKDLVTSFKMLDNLDTHLILVGAINSPHVDEINEMLSNCSRITIVKSTKDLVDFYAAADCFVFASEEETMPLVLQEAAQFKLPRIVSKYQGVSELIPSDDFAFLFSPRDVEKLAKQMEVFLSSPEIAKEMALRSFDHQNSLLGTGEMAIVEAIRSIFEFRVSVYPSEWTNEEN